MDGMADRRPKANTTAPAFLVGKRIADLRID
jgi:hypothetical protein